MSKLLRLIPTPAGVRVSVNTVDRVTQIVARYGLEYWLDTPPGYRRLRIDERPRVGDVTYNVGRGWEDVDENGESAARAWAEDNFEVYVRMWHMSTVRRSDE